MAYYLALYAYLIAHGMYVAAAQVWALIQALS